MSKVKEEFASIIAALEAATEIAREPGTTTSKIDIRLTRGKYKLIVITHPDEVDE